MRKSSIHKQARAGRGSALSVAIGRELRRRRVGAGLTQAALATPFTRAFVSAVEQGLAMPSIPALVLLTDRLDTPLEEFFQGVNEQMTGVYNPGHGYRQDPPPSRR